MIWNDMLFIHFWLLTFIGVFPKNIKQNISIQVFGFRLLIGREQNCFLYSCNIFVWRGSELRITNTNWKKTKHKIFSTLKQETFLWIIRLSNILGTNKMYLGWNTNFFNPKYFVRTSGYITFNNLIDPCVLLL